MLQGAGRAVFDFGSRNRLLICPPSSSPGKVDFGALWAAYPFFNSDYVRYRTVYVRLRSLLLADLARDDECDAGAFIS